MRQSGARLESTSSRWFKRRRKLPASVTAWSVHPFDTDCVFSKLLIKILYLL